MDKKIKIILGMATAFILSIILSKTIMFPSSPRFNKNYFYALYNRIFPKPMLKKNSIGPDSNQFRYIGNGVYANEKNNSAFIKIENESGWKQTIVEYKGRRIIIRTPQ